MASFLWLCGWMFGIGAIAYHRLSLGISCISVLAGLLFTWLGGGYSGGTCTILVTFFSILAIFINNKRLRSKYISAPILKQLKKQLPTISSTEQIALDAGTVSWDGELFSGKPNWKKLFALPAPKFSKEEQAFLDGPVEKLCSIINDWNINHRDKKIPQEIWDFLKQEKFFGLCIPKKYQGLEFSALAHSEILAKVAGRSTTIASLISVPNSIGPAELIAHYGTQQQKDHYLSKLACGEEIPCFALTSPTAGSDATAINDTGVVCYDHFQGSKQLGIRISWNKRYITLAPVATVLGLAFKLYDPEHLLGQKTKIGITCALIPTHLPGITIGAYHIPLMAGFPNGPTSGKDVFIPIDWIVGGVNRAGQGWKMLVECLSCGRAISIPSAATGKVRVAAAATGAYARIRRQFKQPIGSFAGIEEPLARIASTTYLVDAACKLTTSYIDNGEKPVVLGAIIKYHVTELSRKISMDVMDIHGGKGIMLGPKNYAAEGYINAPIGVTVEGANILTRCLIIFGQGAMRCHPYIMQELNALQHNIPSQALLRFDNVLFKHLGYTISNATRAFYNAITFGKCNRAPVSGATGKYYRWINWGSSSFAFLSDICLITFGGKLKFKERVSARLGDLLAILYLASATLKRFHNDGQPSTDLLLVEKIMLDLMSTFWSNVNELVRNLPNRWLAYGLRVILLPLGQTIHKASFQLDRKVAAILMQPSPNRDRLIQGAYLSANSNNPIGQLEIALKHVVAAEPIEQRLRQASTELKIDSNCQQEYIKAALQHGLITETEAMLLKQAHKARDEIIAVDQFAAESNSLSDSQPAINLVQQA